MAAGREPHDLGSPLAFSRGLFLLFGALSSGRDLLQARHIVTVCMDSTRWDGSRLSSPEPRFGSSRRGCWGSIGTARRRRSQRWLDFHQGLADLEGIQVPRWLSTEGATVNAEIHGFADASERAYAAVTYLRVVRSNGAVEVHLVATKSKMAPLKQVTLPRLELCAAALLARLVVYVKRILDIKTAPVLWSDSTVALGWIRGHPSVWKTYVANRISEIQTILPDVVWRHTPGRDNPADCASGGLSPRELVDHPLWWRGPAWLREGSLPGTCPREAEDGLELPDHRTRVHAVFVPRHEIAEEEILGRFSSLSRLLRVTAWCLRWRRRARERTDRRLKDPALAAFSASELSLAQRTWVRVV